MRGHLKIFVARVLGDGMGVDLLGSGEVSGLDGLPSSPLDLRLLGLGLGIGARCGVDGDGATDTVGGGDLQQLVDDRAQLILRDRTLEHGHRLPGDEGHDRGDGLGLEGLGNLQVARVDVDARYLETAGVLPGELLQEGGQLGTGLAARTVEDDDDGDLGGDLGDVTQAGGVDVDHQRHRQAATCTSGSTGRGSRGASGRAGRLGGGSETGQVDGAEHAHEQLPSSGRSPVCFIGLGLSVSWSAGAANRPSHWSEARARQRPDSE